MNEAADNQVEGVQLQQDMMIVVNKIQYNLNIVIMKAINLLFICFFFLNFQSPCTADETNRSFKTNLVIVESVSIL